MQPRDSATASSPLSLRRLLTLAARDTAMALREPSTLACYVLTAAAVAFFGSMAAPESSAELTRLASAWMTYLAIAMTMTSTVSTHLANTIIRENAHGDYLTLVRCGVRPGEIVAAKLIAALLVNAIATMLALLAIDALCPAIAGCATRTPGGLAALLLAGCAGGAPLIVGSIAPCLSSRDFSRDGWWVIIPTAMALAPIATVFSPGIATPFALLPMGPAGELVFSAIAGRAPALPAAALMAVYIGWLAVGAAMLVRAAHRFSCSIAREAAA